MNTLKITNIIIDLLQTAGIAYLLGVHFVTQKHLKKFVKNSIYGKEPVSKYPEEWGIQCPYCGTLNANLHHEGNRCLGCDVCDSKLYRAVRSM